MRRRGCLCETRSRVGRRRREERGGRGREDPRAKRKGRVSYGYAYGGAGVSGGTPAPPPSPSRSVGGKGVHLQDRGVSVGDDTATTSAVQASWEPAAASISTSKRATNAHASIEMVRGT